MGLKDRVEQILRQQQQLEETLQRQLENQPKVPSFHERAKVVLDLYVEKYSEKINSLMDDAVAAARLTPHYQRATLFKRFHGTGRYSGDSEIALTYRLELGAPYGIDNNFTLAIIPTGELPEVKIDVLFYHDVGPGVFLVIPSYARKFDSNIFSQPKGTRELEDVLYEAITKPPTRDNLPSYKREGG